MLALYGVSVVAALIVESFSIKKGSTEGLTEHE